MGREGSFQPCHTSRNNFVLEVRERDHVLSLTHEHFSFSRKLPLCLCKQIQQWEQNLERFHMDLFRMRCYLASLQGGELPNPKSLLAAASRPSKLALGRLGILSVSSFHALVSAPGRSGPQLCCDVTQ